MKDRDISKITSWIPMIVFVCLLFIFSQISGSLIAGLDGLACWLDRAACKSGY